MNKSLRILQILIFVLLFTTHTAIGEDTSNVTVEVDGNDPEIFVDLDFQSLDEIYESNKNPDPLEVVDIQVQMFYVDNTSNEINCTFYHDDGTDQVSFIYQEMVFNSTQDKYNTTFGGYTAGTTVYYYVRCFDGQNYARSPSSGFSFITWQTSGGGSGVDTDRGFDFTPSIQQYNNPSLITTDVTMEFNLEVSGTLNTPYIINLTEDVDYIYAVDWELHYSAPSLDFYYSFGANSSLTNGINVLYQQESLLKNQNITSNIDFSNQEFQCYAWHMLSDDNNARYLFAKWVYVGEGKEIDTLQDYQIYIQDDLTNLKTVTQWNVTIKGYKVLGSNDGNPDFQEVFGQNLEPDLIQEISEFGKEYGNIIILGMATLTSPFFLYLIVKNRKRR